MPKTLIRSRLHPNKQISKNKEKPNKSKKIYLKVFNRLNRK